MQFVVGDIPRFAYGFANPNHAAAAICALLPFCWGWRRFAWIGWVLSAGLVVMLAMTFSRTGLVVVVLEMAAWLWMKRKGGWEISPPLRSRRFCIAIFSVVSIAVALVVWMWPRMALDGAVMNRPKIWLAGMKLFAANPMGVGFGNSGLIANAFLLPYAIEVRTLVNSHLTMLVEGGALIGGAWLVLVAAALLSRGRMQRTWIAFAGLSLSACSASVFDWHILFGLGGAPEFGSLNMVLSWVLLAAYLLAGVSLIVRGFAWKRVGIAFGGVSAGMALMLCADVDSTPKVSDGVVAWGDGPMVCHDEAWRIKTIREYFPKGARIRIASGVAGVTNVETDMWLFGTTAESAARFPDCRVTVVNPPAYYEPPANVTELIE